MAAATRAGGVVFGLGSGSGSAVASRAGTGAGGVVVEVVCGSSCHSASSVMLLMVASAMLSS